MTYALASWLFLRLLGLIYLAAFISLATQIRGLIGAEGILPAAEFLAEHRRWGFRRFYRLPTLCWLNPSDGFLLFLSWGGAALGLLLVAGFAPVPVLILLWIFYLSIFTVGRVFLGYQWDLLLLETGFLAPFLAPLEIVPQFPPVATPSPIILALFWWLLFRLMFSAGAVKWRSGDVTWRKLTALSYHYETQPLPTSLSWHTHQLPIRCHQVSTAIMFAIELFVPFLILAPPPWRYAAAGLFVLLMVLIQLTGNYCFFNLLLIALSILLLDDRFLWPAFQTVFPGAHFESPTHLVQPWPSWLAAAMAGLILILSVDPILRLFRTGINWPDPLARFFDRLEPFRLVNSYGLFSVMTIERPEIIVEGSNDGATWLPYEFKWKPGDVRRAPHFVAPHQPRLDWQMWFAAPGYYPNHPWFGRFLERLLASSPAVLGLLKTNPFAEGPPRYLRAIMYDYRFTTRTERRATGAWWRRERRHAYSPTRGS